MGNCSLLLINSVEFLAASHLFLACTSLIVHFMLKMTTKALCVAEIIASMEINYRIDNVECMHGNCMQLVIVHSHIVTYISMLLVIFQFTSYNYCYLAIAVAIQFIA